MFGNVVVLLAPSLEVGKLSLLWNARFLVFRNRLYKDFAAGFYRGKTFRSFQDADAQV